MLREHVMNERKTLERTAPGLLDAVLQSPVGPDALLASHEPAVVDLTLGLQESSTV